MQKKKIENSFLIKQVSTAQQLAAEAAVDIIRKDFGQWHSVAALAKKVHMTELELQVAFKMVHGKTVTLYSREIRLQYGHGLLEQHDYPLRVVCEMVGYPDPSNFSCAFLRQFGYRPGEIQRKKRGQHERAVAGLAPTEGTINKSLLKTTHIIFSPNGETW